MCTKNEEVLICTWDWPWSLVCKWNVLKNFIHTEKVIMYDRMINEYTCYGGILNSIGVVAITQWSLFQPFSTFENQWFNLAFIKSNFSAIFTCNSFSRILQDHIVTHTFIVFRHPFFWKEPVSFWCHNGQMYIAGNKNVCKGQTVSCTLKSWCHHENDTEDFAETMSKLVARKTNFFFVCVCKGKSIQIRVMLYSILH